MMNPTGKAGRYKYIEEQEKTSFSLCVCMMNITKTLAHTDIFVG